MKGNESVDLSIYLVYVTLSVLIGLLLERVFVFAGVKFPTAKFISRIGTSHLHPGSTVQAPGDERQHILGCPTFQLPLSKASDSVCSSFDAVVYGVLLSHYNDGTLSSHL